MKVILYVVGEALSSFIYIAFLLILFLMIYSLIGMQLFGGKFNFEDNPYRENFNSFLNSFLSVFQVLTSENWPDILYLAMRSNAGAVLSNLYLISWFFIGNFVFLNLFLAILLDGFTREHSSEENDEEDEEDEVEEEIINEKNSKPKKNKNTETMIEGDFDEDFINRNENEKKDDNSKEIICEESLYFFSKSNPIRIICVRIAQHNNFENFILFNIILSSLKLIILTYYDENVQKNSITFIILDYYFNIIFAIESLIKIIAFGFFLDENSYLRESWSVLDFIIVISSTVDMSISSIDLPAIKVCFY